MYVDTDFLVAILKKQDWLKENAERLYEKHKQELWTSTITLQELLLIAGRENFDQHQTLEAVMNLVQVKSIELNLEILFKAVVSCSPCIKLND